MFEQALKAWFTTLIKSKSYNLTKLQKLILELIINQKKLYILLAGKTLVTMVEIKDYHAKAMADKHLVDRKTFEIVSKEKAQSCLVENTSAFSRG